MNYRYQFASGKKVSVVGFGGWQLGNQSSWNGSSIEEGIALVKEAIKNGVTFFDTAPNYADGNSEKIIGEGIKGYRDQVIINTKVGHGPNGEWAFSPEGIRASVQRSLRQLQTNYIDSVILHNPEQYVLKGESELPQVLKELKQEGLIHQWGISIDSLEELDLALKYLNPDVIEIMFNIIHQEPRYLFDEIQKRNILLIIKVPLDSGWLSGKYDEHSSFTGVRARWDKKTIQTRADFVKKIKTILHTEEIAPLALQYILSYSAVSTVIPGIKTKAHLFSNIGALNHSITPEQVQLLETLYENEIKQKETPW